MQVSISKAADMVGVTRATFYRHIEKKGISIDKDDEGNPRVDVSELIRVYGQKVKIPGDDEAELNTSETPESRQPIQNNTPPSIQVQIEVLKERISNLENERQHLDKERSRERDQLLEQIDTLKDHLSSSEEQQKRLTALLTDQRKPVENNEGNEETDRRIVELTRLLESQIKGRQEYDEKFKALEERLSEMKEKGSGVLKSLSEKNKKLAEENRLLKEESEKSIWKKLFG